MNAITFSREEWARMLAAHGTRQTDIARTLGVSNSTVHRLLQSRAAKRRRTGTCRVCGGTTRYNGHGISVSRRCAACQLAHDKAKKVWTADRIVDAVQRFAAANGRPPTSTEWVNADPANGYPPRSNVYGPGKPFARWADAIEAAGFARPTRGRRSRTEVAA